ncbi:MAG TPA: YbaB/EbfC family nucleoid-associated protein [Pseudonocardiaceae bacterium]|nr:YbaB/EbfC family nucleoid-associated protein [Pseudonocardiaceae bacterium]
MAEAGDERARLEARSAVLREKVTELSGEFDKRAAQLAQAHQAAAALVAELTSPDDTVRMRIDSSGMLTQLWLSPTAFDRTSPEALARTISDLVRRGTTQVRRQAAELMRPLTEGLPDVSDLVPGVPSLTDMLPKIPEDAPPPQSPEVVSDPRPEAIISQPAQHPPRPTTVDDDQSMPATWLQEDYL